MCNMKVSVHLQPKISRLRVVFVNDFQSWKEKKLFFLLSDQIKSSERKSSCRLSIDNGLALFARTHQTDTSIETLIGNHLGFSLYWNEQIEWIENKEKISKKKQSELNLLSSVFRFAQLKYNKTKCVSFKIIIKQNTLSTSAAWLSSLSNQALASFALINTPKTHTMPAIPIKCLAKYLW